MRYPLLDIIRSIAIISMILYHTCWDLVFIFGIKITWFSALPGFIWEQSICWTFIILSGFCQTLAHHSLKDGIIVSLAGLLVTLISIIFQIGVEIYFGILTFLGSAILITAFLKKYLEDLKPLSSLIVCAVLFVATYNLRNGYLGLGSITISLQNFRLFTGMTGWILDYVGLPQIGFSSGDYFPLLPWFFLFLFGFFLAKELKDKDSMRVFTRGNMPALEWIGRHSLVIYLLHQPIIYLLLSIIFN